MRLFVLHILAFGLLGQLLQAQGMLTLPSVEVAGREIRIQCVAAIDGQRVFPGQHDVKLFIDGRWVVSDIAVLCRDSTEEFDGVSAALVTDMSGSMRWKNGEAALEGLRAYLSSMDGQRDEATMLFFNNYIRVVHIMSSDTASLREALKEYAPNGGGVLWDAAYAGLIELHSISINPTRAVIVISDGTGALSSRTATDVIDLAQRHRVPVYFISVPPGGDEEQMESIAEATGGRMFAAEERTEVPAIYAEIYRDLKEEATLKTIDTCVVISPTGCLDGKEHRLDMQVRLNDSLHAVASTTFRLPLDSTTAERTLFRLGTGIASAGGGVNIPLEVLPVFPRYPFYRARLQPMGFDIHFDTTRCHYEGAVFTADALADTLSVSAVSIPGGVRIQLEDTAEWVVPPDGMLLSLRFRMRNTADTSAVVLRASNVTVDDACLAPLMLDGSIAMVYEDTPRIAMNCAVDGMLESDDTQRTATVRLQVWNDGAEVLKDCSATLVMDSTLRLAGGGTLSQRFTPDTLPPWRVGEEIPEITWTLQYDGQPWCRSRWLPVQALVTVRDSTGSSHAFHCETTVIVRGADPTQLPVAYGTASPALLCAGDSLVLDAGADFVRYLWSTGENTRSIVVHDSGSYWCDVWTSTCRLRHSDSLHVRLLTPAAVPTVVRRGDTLIAETGYRQYQWFRDGEIVSGYGYYNYRLPVDRHGSYSVRVTNEYGCIASSDSVRIDHLEDPLLEQGAVTFTLYPLPASDFVNVRSYFLGEEAFTITLFDLLGRRRRELSTFGGDRVRNIRMNLFGLSPGVYLIRMQSGAGSAWRMLPVE